MDKSGICASACTVASQWLLVRLVDYPFKAQVAHRFFVARLFFRHYVVLSGEDDVTDLAGMTLSSHSSAMR
jgi:hypothetical protein